MNDDEHATLVRVDQKVISIEKWAELHGNHDDVRFERNFNFVKEQFGKLDARFDKIDEKLDTLWDDKNRHEGAFGFGKWIAGCVGGLIVAAMDYFASGRHS